MQDEFNPNRRWINYGTGEIKDNVRQIHTQEEIERKTQAAKYYKENILPLPGFLQQEYGDFIHARYLPLLQQINNDTATAFRFIYLCTFMEYETGYLMYNKRKVDKRLLIKLLGVSANTATNIINSMLSYNLIYSDKDNYYYINNIYCNKGSNKNIGCYHYTRIFIDSIRELYNKAISSREHKLLGKFILLLPYINIYHNIICKNIKEKEIKKLILPSSSDLDNILGVSERHSDRTMKELLEITVGGRPAILNISHNQAKMYAINPAIYYGGTNLSHLKELNGYFEAEGGLD